MANKEIDGSKELVKSFFKIYFSLPVIYYRGWLHAIKTIVKEGGSRGRVIIMCYSILAFAVILYILSPLFLVKVFFFVCSSDHGTYAIGAGIFPFLLGMIKLLFRREDAYITFITRKWVAEKYPEWVKMAGPKEAVEKVLTYEYSLKITIISGVILTVSGILFTFIALFC